MGKYLGNNRDLKIVPHPLLDRKIYVPADYKFHNTSAEREKFNRTFCWAQDAIKSFSGESESPLVLDAFAGVGILTLVYLHLGFKIIAIERNPSLLVALLENIQDLRSGVRAVYGDDNMNVFSRLGIDDSRIKVIDLDPYGSCILQIKEAARILKQGFLFVTAGDICAGARFKNWEFVQRRYGIEFSGPSESYPTEVIFPFIQREFKKLEKTAKLHDFFSFPTICRLCVEIT